MTRKDFRVLAEMLAGIAFTEECLGEGVRANRLAIDDYLSATNHNYNSKIFWLEFEKHLLANKLIFK